MKVVRTLATVTLALAPVAAFALPAFVKEFTTVYNVDKATPLGKARCATCHVGNNAAVLNPYGKDVAQALQTLKTDMKLTPAVLHSIENRDSDGDGASNLTEIQAGTLPGDPSSKPAPGTVSTPTTGTTGVTGTTETTGTTGVTGTTGTTETGTTVTGTTGTGVTGTGMTGGMGGSMLRGSVASPLFGPVAPGKEGTFTVSVPGAAVGDVVFASPNGPLPAGLLLGAPYVSGTGIVTVALYNSTTAPITPAGRVWNVVVFRLSAIAPGSPR